MTIVARRYLARPIRTSIETWTAITNLICGTNMEALHEFQKINGIASALIAEEIMKDSPTSCDYRIILDTNPSCCNVPGWRPTTYRSTEGFVRQSVGTTIGTHAIGSQAKYWRKN
ncbi:MAG: hypothetical protein NG784_13300 [Candidatus Jettenia sp.]|nr:hypothetical protein [Candidatus Jettenia sp.]